MCLVFPVVRRKNLYWNAAADLPFLQGDTDRRQPR